MKDIKEYKTTGEWYKDARKEGYRFPLALCNGLDEAQNELNLSFSEVFELFVKYEVIINVLVYDMRGYRAIKDECRK